MPFSKAATSEDARRTLRYVKLLSEARTKLADFFSIVPGRTSRQPLAIGLRHEHSLARIHAGELSGDVILEQTQPDPPSGCEPHGCLNVNATGASAL